MNDKPSKIYIRATLISHLSTFYLYIGRIHKSRFMKIEETTLL